ncbi:hypothetical protein BC936DRAFT_142502 [Jimgerdemannia flammicorona]|uniref:Uncharacterized protein n=1 Tax=Jimgerdemannia flammicorona TaxID=994334 RepID=A0A433DF50_9FUNG|nr:hypothetical protein BC936DRAFT_142502 [Jimgerdemannia flammicorona]
MAKYHIAGSREMFPTRFSSETRGHRVAYGANHIFPTAISPSIITLKLHYHTHPPYTNPTYFLITPQTPPPRHSIQPAPDPRPSHATSTPSSSPVALGLPPPPLPRRRQKASSQHCPSPNSTGRRNPSRLRIRRRWRQRWGRGDLASARRGGSRRPGEIEKRVGLIGV